MEKIISQIILLIQDNLKVEIVEWYDGTFSIRLFWDKYMFFESTPSTGRLMEE